MRWIGILLLGVFVSACAGNAPEAGDPSMGDDSADKSVTQGTDDGWLYSDDISRYMGKLGPWLSTPPEQPGKCVWAIWSKSNDYDDRGGDADLTKKGADRYQLPADHPPEAALSDGIMIQVITTPIDGTDGFRPVMCLNAAQPGDHFEQCGDVTSTQTSLGVSYATTSILSASDFLKTGWLVVTNEETYNNKAHHMVPIPNGNGRYRVVIKAPGDCPLGNGQPN
jgi:hypothetical protein